MDVQGATATSLPPAFTQSVSPPPPQGTFAPSAGAAASTIPVVSGTDPSTAGGAYAGGSGTSNASGNAGSASSSAIGPTPGLATLPAGPPDGTKKGSEVDTTVASGVAQLYNVQEQNISVSFQIQQNPNEIVTVFTDKQTGKVIVQFPSETMIALAKLFDKLDGSVVNKKV